MPFVNMIDYITNDRQFITESVGKSLDYNNITHEALEPGFNERKLSVSLADVEDFIKKNDVKEVSNPVFFIRDNIPSPDGLLSNEIFGITKEERSNLWGYIDLHGTFFHPFIYKLWGKMDRNIRSIVHGLGSFGLDHDGYIVPVENGETGINFIIKNIDKIKIKTSNSMERKNNIAFINKNRDKMFIKKMLVQPAFYRDVLTGRGRVEVGQLNKYYSSLLIACKGLVETQDMGFSLGDATIGRVQEILLDIFKCITGTSGNPDDGTGLSGKTGIISNSLERTVDYGSRLVLSAPELKVEKLEDLQTDTEHCALPLASAIVNFKPFVVFNVKRYFENEFGEDNTVPVSTKDKKIIYAKVKEPRLLYSEQNIEKEIKEFVHSYSNRFKPVMVPIIDDSGKEYMGTIRFKGKTISPEEYAKGNNVGSSPLIDRPLTWLDILYMAAVEATKDKCVLITRYPIDSAYNQIPQLINISTIKQTEPIYVGNTYYRWYPKLRNEDVGSNTSNKFIDTLNICNLMIGGMGADYDGDTVGIKGCWIQETNEELIRHLKSKSNYVDFTGNNIRKPSNEAIQSLYNLTKVLPADKSKLTNPVF